MKTKFWTKATVLAACLYTTAASAEMVFAIKGGAVDYGIEGSDPGLNASLQLAFDVLELGLADIAVEGEYSTSLTDSEISFGPGTADSSFESTALYASLRTAGPVYVIARVGLARSEIEINGGGSTDDEGVAMGVGVGFSLGMRMEIEYTRYEPEIEGFGDLDVEYLTLGFGF